MSMFDDGDEDWIQSPEAKALWAKIRAEEKAKEDAAEDADIVVPYVPIDS